MKAVAIKQFVRHGDDAFAAGFSHCIVLVGDNPIAPSLTLSPIQGVRQVKILMPRSQLVAADSQRIFAAD
jgi:hypothetical protein